MRQALGRLQERPPTAAHQRNQNLSSSLNVDQIFDHIAQQTVYAGNFRSMTVSIIDESNNEYRVIRNYISRDEDGNHVPGKTISSKEEDLVPIRSYPLDDPSSWTAQACLAGKLIVRKGWGHNIKESRQAATTDETPDPKFKVAYFIPVALEGRTIAVLATGSDADEEEAMLERIGAMQPLLETMAIALDRGQAYEALQKEVEIRKQAEEKIHYQANLLQNITESVIATDLNLCITSWNKAAENMYGWCEGEVIGKNLDEICQTEFVDIEKEEAQKLLLNTGEWKGEVIQKTKEGEIVYGMVSVSLLKDFQGNPVGGVTINRDITKRKQAEEALHESEMRFRSLFQSMNEGVCLHEVVYDDRHVVVDYRILDANPSYEEILGFSRGSVLGKLASEVYGSGKPPYLDTYAEVVKTGKPVRIETYFPPMDKHFSISIFSLEKERFATAFEDITERKHMEEELRKNQNLESLGVLAGGIAHDFNNVLTGVIGSLALLDLMLDKDSDAHRIAVEGKRAADRTRDLTQQLLTFAKGGAPIKEVTSIEALVRETTELSLHGSNTKPEFHLAENLHSVDIDQGQIGQVIQNLVLNADQAMPEGGILKVSAENVELSSHNSLLLTAGPYVRVSVVDQGIGMSEEVMAKVFDPYFSTKTSGHGLGLSITHSIVQRHDGHITVHSVQNVGTTFEFYLPAFQGHASTSPGQDRELARGTERILLMDDEELIHKTLGKALTLFGYQVHSAYNGEEALASYQAATAQPFDLAIMDLTIPGGSGGKETVEKLLAIDPQARVLVASGYANDPVMANYAEYGFVGAISKPVDIHELAETIKRILEDRK